MDNRTLWQKGWPPFTALVVFLALWEAACRWLPVDPWVLPAPSAIGRRMAEESGMLAYHLTATLGLAMSGVGIGFAIGVVLAVVLHRFISVRTVVSPFVIMSQNLPTIVLAPLLMIWFGFGLTPKLILVALVGFFPVAWSMLTGLGRAEPQLREYMAMIGANRWQTLCRLELPASLPYLFTGLKLTATYSVTTAIVAEWLGASRGIGYYIILKFKGYDIEAVFASVICIVALCMLLYGLTVWLERLVVYWGPRNADSMRKAGGPA